MRIKLSPGAEDSERAAARRSGGRDAVEKPRCQQRSHRGELGLDFLRSQVEGRETERGGGGGKKEKNTTTERSPPYAQRISCSAGFATAGEGGGRSGARGLARRRAGRGRAEEPSARRAPLPCGDSPALGMGMAAPPPISDNNSN